MYTNAHTHTLTNTERNICKKSLKSEQHKRYAQVANRNTDTPSNHSFKTNRLNQSTDNFSGFPHNGSIHRRDGQSECGLRDASGQHSRQRPGEPRRRRFHPHRVRFVLRLQPLSGGQYIVRGFRTACTQNRTKHHRKCQKTGGRHGERQAATTSDLTGLFQEAASFTAVVSSLRGPIAAAFPRFRPGDGLLLPCATTCPRKASKTCPSTRQMGGLCGCGIQTAFLCVWQLPWPSWRWQGRPRPRRSAE